MPNRRIWNLVRKSAVEMPCDVDAAPQAMAKWVDANDHPIAVVPGKMHVRISSSILMQYFRFIESIIFLYSFLYRFSPTIHYVYRI